MKLPLPTSSPKYRAWYVFSGLWVLASIALSISVSEEIFNNDDGASLIFCFLALSLATFLPIAHDWIAPKWSNRWIFALVIFTFVATTYFLLVEGFFNYSHRRTLDDEFIMSVFLSWSVAYFFTYWLTNNYEPPKKRQQKAVQIETENISLHTNDRSPSPGVWKYIWAWLVASVLSGIAGSLLFSALATLLLTPSNFSSSIYWAISPIAVALASLAIWILVYSFFSTLIISKVAPWMWVLMGLGYLVSIAEISTVFDDLNRSTQITTIFSLLAAYLLNVLGFSRYFKARHPSRY